jgi:hypothetical protein
MTAIINLDPAAKAKLNITAGQYVDFTITATDTNGNPYSFIGYSAQCQIRNQQKGKDYLILALTVVLTEGLIHITGDVPSGITLGTFTWALEITTPATKTEKWITGIVTITADGVK